MKLAEITMYRADIDRGAPCGQTNGAVSVVGRRHYSGKRSAKNGDVDISIVTSGRRSWFEKPGQLYQQSYDEITARCRQTGQLFEDPLFPADARSIGKNDKRYEWKRPGVSY